jgi:RNA polymerase sigma factor (sigma-70 family)
MDREPAGAPDVEDLLARVEGARRLARRLVRDPSRADDVAQQAMLASLVRPPRAGWAPTAWLAGVVRNLARKDARGEGRRARHEGRASRPEGTPSTADLVARLEVHRLLLDAVRVLAEPYRAAILLRYFEGLPPREIARSSSIPVATVRSHLRRGLAQLRERLDATHGGDRRSWSLAMVPLAVRTVATTGPAFIPVVSIAAAAVLVAGGIAWRVLAAGSDDGSNASPAANLVADASPTNDRSSPQAPPLLAAAPHTHLAATKGRGGIAWIAGVVRENGVPAAGVRVEARISPPLSNDIARRTLQNAERGGARSTRIAETTTDVAGRFLLSGLDAPTMYFVVAAPDGERVGTMQVLRPTDPAALSVELSAGPGRRVRGRLVSTAASPLLGWFSVSTLWRGGQADVPRPATTEGATGEDGRFDAMVGTAGVHVSVGTPSRGERYFSVDAPWSGERDFALDTAEGAAVAGQVRDGAGAAVAGARVVVAVFAEASGGGQVRLLTTAGADGRYVIDGLPAGRIESLAAEAAGFAPAPWLVRATPLRAGETTTVDLTLRRAAMIEGRVVEQGGAAVAEVEVLLSFDAAGGGNGSDLRQAVQTDAEGRFRFDGLPEGSGEIAVMGPRRFSVVDRTAVDDQVPPTAPVLEPLGRARPPTAVGFAAVRIQSEGERREIVIATVAGRSLAGRVVSEEGRPIVDALVVATSAKVGDAFASNTWRRPFVAKSSADGGFAFEALPVSDDWQFAARRPDARGETTEPVVLPADGAAPDVIIRLRTLGLVTGRVIGADGKPAADAFVSLVPTTARAERRTAPTNIDGCFRFEGVARGRYRVGVSSSGGRFIGDPVSIDGETTSTPAAVELRIEPTYFATGVIVDADGKPLAWTSVNVLRVDVPTGRSVGTSAITDADGRFTAAGLESGRYRVGVSWPTRPEDPEIEAGARDVRLVAVPAPKPQFIEGTILGPDGKRVSSAELTLWVTHDGGGSFGSAQGAAAEGQFRIQPSVRPVPDHFTLVVADAKDESGKAIDAAPAVVEATCGTPIDIRLEAGHSITGHVFDDEGKPVEGAAVSASPRSSPITLSYFQAEWSVKTDAQGAFRVRALPAGEIVVGVTAVGEWSSGTHETVAADREDVVLRVTRGVSLSGRVVGPDDEPVPGYGVSTEAGDPHAPDRGVVTDGGGRFTLAGLPRDVPFALRVDLPPNRTGESWLPRVIRGVRPSSEVLVVHLRRGVFVEGVVEGPDGARVSDGEVVAEHAASGHVATRYARTRFDPTTGKFRLGPLEPGPFRIGYQNVSLWCEFAALEPLDVMAPSTGTVLRLVHSRTLVVRVLPLDAKGGMVTWNPGVGSLGKLSRSLGADRAVSITGLTDEPGVLYVLADDDQCVWREGVRPTMGSIDVTLEPGTTIRGRLEGAWRDGRGALTIFARRGPYGISTSVGPDGRFEVRAVPPGTYRVEMDFGPLVGGVDGVVAGAQDVVVPVTLAPSSDDSR